MNYQNKSRWIGIAVLALVGVLFLPAALNPPQYPAGETFASITAKNINDNPAFVEEIMLAQKARSAKAMQSALHPKKETTTVAHNPQMPVRLESHRAIAENRDNQDTNFNEVALKSAQLAAQNGAMRPNISGTTFDVIAQGGNLNNESVNNPANNNKRTNQLNNIENPRTANKTNKNNEVAMASPNLKMGKGTVSLQIASFGARNNAEITLNQYSGEYPVHIEEARINGKIFYRVLLGPFSDEKTMNEVAKKIEPITGSRPVIVRH